MRTERTTDTHAEPDPIAGELMESIDSSDGAHSEEIVERLLAASRALEEWHAAHGPHGSLVPSSFEERYGRFSVRAPLPAIGEPTAATLRYSSPEHIGRITDDDPRSDLYLLGIVFYEWLSGDPPFMSDDLLQIVHEHMSSTPAPLRNSVPELPEVIDQLVQKLLAKSPDARYATAGGLRHDLDRILRLIRAGEMLDGFELGAADRRSQFMFPDRLYGRDDELSELDYIFQRVRAGELVLCLVAGYSGVGKSALVQQIRQSVGVAKGKLVEGKYDQYHSDVPYSALIEAFRNLFRQVLSGDPDEVERWAVRLRETLGENASVVADVLPELTLVIGQCEPAPELSGPAAQDRFNQVFSDVLKLFASPAHPLVMFLDDLQWADAASLTLIQHFVRVGRGASLMLVGAYRNNEVGPSHPLTGMIEELRATTVTLIAEQTLLPLREEHVVELITDTCGGITGADALGHLVYRKAEGNPFYTRQLLKSMVDAGQLYYDNEFDAWRWNLGRHEELTVAENVVELMTERLRTFPEQTMNALRVAACIGKAFELGLLAEVLGETEAETLTDLAPALHDQLIAPMGRDTRRREFRFAHDRVQQAAYALDGEEPLDEVHLLIGTVLLKRTPPEERDHLVFVIADQINHGLQLVDDFAQRRQFAEINYRAGTRAKSAMAYEAATVYLDIGIELLADDVWKNDHDLAYGLYINGVEVDSMCNFEAAYQEKIAVLLEHAKPGAERLAVRTRQTIHFCQGSMMQEGLEVGRQGLQEVGIKIPPLDDFPGLRRAFMTEIERFEERTAGVDLVPFLTDLPVATDDEIEQILRLIGAMGDAATIMNMSMLNLMAGVGANLSLERGNTRLAPLMYTLHAQGLIAELHIYGPAAAMARAAAILCDGSLRDLWSFGRTKVHQYWFVLHWSRHVATSLPEIEQDYATTRRAHDPLYGAYLLSVATITRFFMGQSMSDVSRAHDRVVDHCRPYPMGAVVAFTEPYAGAAAALSGHTSELTDLDCDAFNLEHFVDLYGEMPMVMGLLRGAQTAVHGLAGDHERVLELVDDPMLAVSPPFPPHLPVTFWRGVAAAALADSRPDAGAELSAALAMLEHVHHTGSPENVAHRLAFLQGEQARLNGDIAGAAELYREAWVTAEANGYVLEQGYLLERLGLLHISQGDRAKARTMWEMAAACWRACDAVVLARRAQGRVEELQRDRSGEEVSEFLDVVDTVAVLRAVQLISSETDLDRVLDRLLTIMLEASGAERAVLLRRQGSSLRVERQLGVDRSRQYPTGFTWLVMNTNTVTSLTSPADNLAEGGGYDPDGDKAYFGASKPAAVLGIPIGRKEPIGRMLYLEHRFIEDVFNPARRRVIEWLASQAAISIENAELYDRLEQRVNERTRDLTESNRRLSAQQKELKAAIELADQANKAKSAFLANMSHEIRTPMNAILGMAELLSRTQPTSAQRGHLDRLSNSAEILLRILEHVLDLTKIEADMVDLESIAFDVHRIVRDVCALFTEQAASKGIRMGIRLDPMLPRGLVGDPFRFEQVLLNLVSNAVKFTEVGWVSLDIDSAEDASGKVLLRCRVSDSGIGIDPRRVDELFEPFIQADQSTARRFGGSGLGLTISRRLCELMGGDLSVTSSDAGSSFTAVFPFARSSPPIPSSVAGRSVLIEDTEGQLDSRQLSELTMILEDLGLNVLGSNESQKRFPSPANANLSRAEIIIRSQSGPGVDLDLAGPVGGGLWPLVVALDDVGALEPSPFPFTSTSVLSGVQSAIDEQRPAHGNATVGPEEKVTGTVLVVEDDELNREVAVAFLEILGIDAVVAPSGADAIQILENAEFDLILMDCQMPGIDGFELAARLRTDARFADMPIIAMTAHSMAGDRQRVMAAGMDDYLAKPFDLRRFDDTVRRWLRNRVSSS